MTSHDTDPQGPTAGQMANRLVQKAQREFSRLRALPYERLATREAVQVA